MRAVQSDFSKGKVSRVILRLALPMTVAQLVNVLYNIVDRLYIGRIPGIGSTALAGVGVAMPVITAITAFANLCGTGGSPLCSIARGRGDTEEAQAIIGNTFALLLITGLLLTGLLFCIKTPLLYLVGASSNTFAYADSYTSIYLIGTLFVMIALGMNGFINLQGFSGIGMLTVIIGAVLNIALDPLFIFTFHMGVEGAAIATVIAQFFSAAWALWFLCGKKAILRLKLSQIRLQSRRTGRILSLGFTGFVMGITNSLVQLAANRMLLQFGGDLYVGIMTVLNSIREVVIQALRGINNGAQPVLSFNYGAREYGRVRQGIRFISLVSLAYAVLMWAIIMLIPSGLIRIFNDDPQMVQAGAQAARIFFCGFCLMSLQFSGQTVFVGLGKARNAIFFSLLRKAVLVVPLTFLLPHVANLGVVGVFLSEPISDVLGNTACFVTMLLTVVRQLKKLERQDNMPA